MVKVNKEERYEYVKNKVDRINQEMKLKGINYRDIRNATKTSASQLSKALNMNFIPTIEYIDRIEKAVFSFDREPIKEKTYIVVTNDEYELIVGLGTLKEIEENYGFNRRTMKSALYEKRPFSNYKYKILPFVFEDDYEN